MQGQDMVNSWDFPLKTSRDCHKKLVSKIVVWHDQREMLVKMSLRDRLDWLDFVGMILLCLLPLPNCFFRVCFPTLFAAELEDFLPLITSPISGAANSNMSAPMRFAAGTKYLRKKGNAVLPITCARVPNTLPLCLPTLYSMEFLPVLKQQVYDELLCRKRQQTAYHNPAFKYSTQFHVDDLCSMSSVY